MGSAPTELTILNGTSETDWLSMLRKYINKGVSFSNKHNT
jgi:hypothetical protein